MSDFDFSPVKRFPRLTLGRAETLNARFIEVATAIASKLDKTGGSITGNLAVSGNFSTSGTLTATGNASLGGTLAVTGNVTVGGTLTLSGDPAGTNQAATKSYVDSGDTALSTAMSNLATNVATAIAAGDNLKLNLTGGTMSGAIAMGGNKISGAGNATNAQDLVTLFQLTATAFNSALPSQAGNSGKYVTTDGVNASWQPVFPAQAGNAGLALLTDGTATLWAPAVRPFLLRTGNFSAVAGYRYRCETAAGAIVSTLPAAPADGNIITFRRKGANALTLSRNGKTISTFASDLVIDADLREVDLTYNATTGDWEVVARAYA